MISNPKKPNTTSSWKYDIALRFFLTFFQLIFETDLSVVLALCDSTQVTEADDVASLLVRLFEGNDKTLSLLKAAVEQEVQRTGIFGRISSDHSSRIIKYSVQKKQHEYIIVGSLH